MKKLITAALAAASLAASLAPAPALARSLNNGWVVLDGDVRGELVFVRKHNWRGQLRVADVKIGDRAVTQEQYNCSKGQARFLSYGVTAWRDIYPGTALHAIFSHVCS
jgi:hypothetical protein